MKLNKHDSVLDDVNLRIIDILSKDSSTPFIEIAKQIGISDGTVHLRVKYDFIISSVAFYERVDGSLKIRGSI